MCTIELARACRFRTRPAAHDTGVLLWGRPALFDSPAVRYIPLDREEGSEVVTSGETAVARLLRDARELHVVRAAAAEEARARHAAFVEAAEWARLMDGSDASSVASSPPSGLAPPPHADPNTRVSRDLWPCVDPACPCPSSWNGLPDAHCCLTCHGGVPCQAPYHRAPFSPRRRTSADAPVVGHASDARRATGALAQLPAALARVRNLAGASRAGGLRSPRGAYYDGKARRHGLELLAQAPPTDAPTAQDQWDAMVSPSTPPVQCADVSDEEPDLPELVSASSSDSE